MKKFEYKMVVNTIFKKSLINEEYFNELGKQGWELVSVSSVEVIAYFKREV